MLGNGRPFILELISPKRRKEIDIKQIQDTINESLMIQVKNLGITDDSCFAELQKSETQKIKAYVCLTITSKKISQETIEKIHGMKDIVVKQKTPLRVLHRRTQMVRDKMIHKLKIQVVNDYTYVVFVLSSAGTYIKEFIHGDLLRTEPSFGDLIGGQADIHQLDVLDLYEEYNDQAVEAFLDLSNVYGINQVSN